MQATGRVDAAVLYAARVAGVERVFKLGGAQAIAAMAYGTASVPKVDKIFGPGNTWVTEAKAQVDRDPDGAARDYPAGPSEVLVIADAGANAAFVASDLLSQAEHGADSQVLLVTTSIELARAVIAAVDSQKARLTRGKLVEGALAHSSVIVVADLPTAFAISNRYAPEHLILQIDRAARVARPSDGSGLGVPRPLDSGIGRRLLQRHESRAADVWVRAPLLEPRRGRFLALDDRAGAHVSRACARSDRSPRRSPRSRASTRTRGP